jgi:hypothetical protein
MLLKTSRRSDFMRAFRFFVQGSALLFLVPACYGQQAKTSNAVPI